jgi:hypothetical protein
MTHHSRPMPYSAQNQSQGQAPEPPTLLRFVRSLSVSFNPRDVIQAPEPYDVIKALDPFAHYSFARPPYCNTLPWVRMGPYPFLLRNRSSPHQAGLPGNL